MTEDTALLTPLQLPTHYLSPRVVRLGQNIAAQRIKNHGGGSL